MNMLPWGDVRWIFDLKAVDSVCQACTPEKGEITAADPSFARRLFEGLPSKMDQASKLHEAEALGAC